MMAERTDDPRVRRRQRWVLWLYLLSNVIVVMMGIFVSVKLFVLMAPLGLVFAMVYPPGLGQRIE